MDTPLVCPMGTPLVRSWRLPLALLVSSVLSLSQPVTSQDMANVTLKGITLFKQRSWFYTPEVYFKCQPGNVTNLSFVKRVMHYYAASGTEAWQPVLRLEAHSCKVCGVYERLWFQAAVLGEWSICTTNFTTFDTSALVTLMSAKSVTVDIACPECPSLEKETEPPAAAPTPPPTKIAPWIWVFVGLGVLILTGTVVMIVVIVRRDGAALVFEERSRILELESSDSARSGTGERSDSDRPELGAMERRHGGQVLRDDSESFV